MKNHLNLTCNPLFHVRLGRVMYLRQYHQLYKVNGIPDNSVFLQCHNQVTIKDADVDVVARVSNTSNTIIISK